ncbi:MAG: hypothetical protein WCJ84_04080 [Candidatus Peregrinibacteria bacterium]
MPPFLLQYGEHLKKQKMKPLCLAILGVGMFSFLVMGNIPVFAAATDPAKSSSGTTQNAAPAGREPATANLSQFGLGTNIQSLETLSGRVISFFMAIVGGLSLLGVIIGGGMMMIGGAVESQLEQGKDVLTYSLIGLGVALLSYVITTFMQTIFYSIE